MGQWWEKKKKEKTKQNDVKRGALYNKIKDYK